MPKARNRVCLEQGLKLDVNKLTRRGWIRPGAKSGPHLIRWTYNHTGEEIASGLIVANMEGKCGGWMRILIGGLDQWIDLATQPRHFGGRQWYFECPVTHRHCSVLWKPSGARRFCSRQTWGRQVAYSSQFGTAVDRAHLAQAKIKSRLLGTCDPDEWDLPPKPKWMRWRTYNRHVQKFDAYDDIRDQHTFSVVARLMARR